MDDRLTREGLRAIGRSFYGTIWENTARIPMGRGYANDNKPFDIDTANYMRAPMEAIRNPDQPIIGILAAVQMLKTFGCIEEPAAYFIEHNPGDMTIYIGGDDSARDQAKARIIPRLRSIPGVAKQLESAEEINRWDVTMQEFYLPGMVLRIWGLNENTTQRVSLKRVLISDAFLSKKTGMIQQAIARTTQHRNERKIVVESQGGETDDDFDSFWKSTNMQLLHVSCPHCGGSQPFEFARERLEGFVPIPPRTIPSLDHSAWIETNAKLLLSPERAWAGFKRGPDDIVKRIDGTYNEAAIRRLTYYECFHCGGEWHDTPETRLELDRSSHYVASNPNALPGTLGFQWPAWAGQRLPWGGDECMLGYLRAKRISDDLGNDEPLKQWYQKRHARPWEKLMGRRSPERIGAAVYDLTEKIPGELCRIGTLDVQFNLTHAIYEAWAIGDGQRPRLLHYEWIKPAMSGLSDQESRAQVKARVRELNREWGIEQQNFMIDAGHRPDLIREWAAEDAAFGKMKLGGRIVNKWITYGLLVGDDRISYRWPHPGRKATLERFKQYDWTDVDCIREGKRVRIPVHSRLWSNTSIKDIATRWRDGDGAPKIEVHEKFLRDNTPEGFWKQMTSERKLPWRGRPGKERYDNEGRPNHAWDGFCQVMVRMDELGYLNNFGPPADEENN